MKKISQLILPVCCSLLFTGYQPFNQGEKWTDLFNGQNLAGWDTYLGPPLDSNGKRISDQPIGLNRDPNSVFSVIKSDGENVIRISGNGWGGISTQKEYSDFHLRLMFKWGKLRWGPQRNRKRDSGLLYFAVGPHGADYGAWMRSQEFQIQEGDCGDYWGVAGGMEDVPAIMKNDSQYVYSPGGQVYTFSANSKSGRRCIKRGDAELPSGQWNTLDLYCHGDTSVHIINGQVMMVLYNSRQWDDGRAVPLQKGKLQIQSEGAEVYYKQIRLQRIQSIPVAFLH